MVNEIISQNDCSVNLSLEEKKDRWTKWPKVKPSNVSYIQKHAKNPLNLSRDITIQKFKNETIIRHSQPEFLGDDKFFSDVVDSSHFDSTQSGMSKRGVITSQSAKSLALSKHYLRNIPDSFCWFWGLTFPDIPKDGLTVKRAREVFLKRVRRAFPGIGYFWIREWQRRGSAHFHFIVDVDVPEAWIRSNWFDIVGDNYIEAMINGAYVDRIHTSVAQYMSDYMNKPYQKIPPEDYINIGRFWGCSRGLLEVIEEKIKNAPRPVVSKCFRVARKAYLHRLKECGIDYPYNSWTCLKLHEISLPGRGRFTDFIQGQWMAYLDHEIKNFNPYETYRQYRPFVVNMAKQILVFLLSGGNKKDVGYYIYNKKYRG